MTMIGDRLSTRAQRVLPIGCATTMERIAKPLLTGVLVWLVALSTAALPDRPRGCHHHGRPGRHPLGHHPHVPAKRGAIPSRRDEEVKPARLLKVPARERALPAPIPSSSSSHWDVCLAPPGPHRQPLYLLLRTLLL
jgi:hypothetical protein